MAYIYKITNTLNEKCYIGKTEKSDPQQRFAEHCRDRFRHTERPLYRALNKYGVENFTFEIVEETDNPEEREIYWIEFYSSYGSTGYNATLGGDGKKYLDYEKILLDYLTLKNMSKVAKINACSVDSVKTILKLNNIEILSNSIVTKTKLSNPVAMLDKNSKEEIARFQSIRDAARYLKENGLSNISGLSGLTTHITQVCKGNRKSCCGYDWEYIK